MNNNKKDYKEDYDEEEELESYYSEFESPIIYNHKTKRIEIEKDKDNGEEIIKNWKIDEKSGFIKEINNWNILINSMMSIKEELPPYPGNNGGNNDVNDDEEEEFTNTLIKMLETTDKIIKEMAANKRRKLEVLEDEIEMMINNNNNNNDKDQQEEKISKKNETIFNEKISKKLPTKAQENALKILDEALNLVLKRPGWGSASLKIEQVHTILSQRYELKSMLGIWEDAYADSIVLVTLNPTLWKNHYRRGCCLEIIENYQDALQSFLTAQGLAFDPMARPVIEKAIKNLEKKLK